MATYRGTTANPASVVDIPEGIFTEDSKSGTKKEPIPDLTVPSLVWQAGKAHAQKTFKIINNIDFLRPYFDVEPKEVYTRIAHSLFPKLPSKYKTEPFPAELYGPLMLVLTLIALLLYGMKTSEHIVKEGTLMGTAFGVSFGYWFGASGLIFVICFISDSSLSFFELLSIVGYGTSGHCITLLLGTLFHPVHSHIYFYLLWLIFGGLTAATMVSKVISRTSGFSQQLTVAAALAFVHLLDILYLHFAYHKTVEALNF